MRRRILQSTLAVVVMIALLLGIPLMFTAWRWVEDISRADLQSRLQRTADEVIAQEGEDGSVNGDLDITPLRLTVPDGGRLVVTFPRPGGTISEVDLGEPSHGRVLTESLSLGARGSLRIEAPKAPVRSRQWQAVTAVALVLVLSICVGTAVALFTARRLARPMRYVADRAARLGAGDFRPDPRRHDINELDRVSDVLDAATAEIAHRLQSERELVSDVSHQFRSRLTAIRLRLDELSTHADPDVVIEATEAMAQVDRLADSVSDMLSAARNVEMTVATPVDITAELCGLMRDWQKPFIRAGRVLDAQLETSLRVRVTPARLREAVSVLVDNALEHGGGRCTVEVREVPGAMACVTVSDEGPGVADDLASRIFMRGFSAAQSTGVGLAMARAMIEAEGGRLELQRRRPPRFAVFLLLDSEDRLPTVRAKFAEPR